MTKDEAIVLAGKLMLAYPREGNPDVIALYADHLVDLDRELTHTAIGRLIRESRWLPTVAEVRDMVRAVAPRYRPRELEAPSHLLLDVDPATQAREVEAAKARVKALVDETLAKMGRARV